jgi:hypothetical protein
MAAPDFCSQDVSPKDYIILLSTTSFKGEVLGNMVEGSVHRW